MKENIYSENNYVLLDGICTLLDKDHLKKIENGKFFEIEPIKLTKEWLENFGFKLDNSKYVYNFAEKEWVEVVVIKEIVIRIDFMFEDYHTYFNVNVDYVHILQNLYKERFNEELILKQQ